MSIKRKLFLYRKLLAFYLQLLQGKVTQLFGKRQASMGGQVKRSRYGAFFPYIDIPMH